MTSRFTERVWFSADCSVTGVGDVRFISELLYVTDIQLVAYELELIGVSGLTAANANARFLGLRLYANGTSQMLGKSFQADVADGADYSCILPIQDQNTVTFPRGARQLKHPITIGMPQVVNNIRDLRVELVEYDDLPTNATLASPGPPLYAPAANLVESVHARFLFEATINTSL